MKATVRGTIGCGGIGVCVVALMAQTQAQDWPQWRGSSRDGVADKSPALIEVLPATGPKMMWECALPPGDRNNPYYTSPVVAGEKAFIHVPAPVFETLPPDSTNKPKQTGVADILVAVGMDDGKIIQFAGSSLVMLDAATGKSLTDGKKNPQVPIVGHSSPAFSNGRLVVNAGTHLRCYDLRKTP